MDIERIYHQYFSALFQYLLSLSGDPHIAEELAQETFLKALKNLEKVDEHTNINAWLCRVARNLYFQHYNKQKRREGILRRNATEDYEPSPEAALFAREGRIRVHKMIHGLSEPYREVFVLRATERLSFREIGEVFDKNETWARMIYFRARKKLMEELRNEDYL